MLIVTIELGKSKVFIFLIKLGSAALWPCKVLIIKFDFTFAILII